MSEEARTVHLVAKTHLDLGFTALAGEVTRRYVDDYFPQAIAVAAELARAGGAERLVWTTGSWILHHALGAGPHEQRDRVAAAVIAGDLAWHALALTTHTELMDVSLFRSGMAISRELDQRFGRVTTAAKMTDVPGHTRSMVPLLAEAGVTFLHLGVNPAWPVPDVPAVFRWRSPDGAEVVVAYQAGGYGGEVVVPGCPDVLAFLHTGDNLGPPSAAEVVAAHSALADRYPGAEVRASTLDAFARALAASGVGARLPIITSEIGDPWIFGAGSDPLKLAAYRTVLRRRKWLGTFTPPARAEAVDRQLLLVAEHTWGLDQKSWLSDDERWDRAGLAAIRATAAGRRFEASWVEQRAYVGAAADLLGPGGGVEELAAGVPRWPLGSDGVPLGGFEPVGAGLVIDGGGWQLALDPATGALAHLVHEESGRVVADLQHSIGLLGYQSFDEADYERFYAQLSPTPGDEGWARADNTKPGIDAAGALSGWWYPEVSGSWHAEQAGGGWHTLLVRLAFPGVPSERLGAPAEAWARWAWHRGRTAVDLDLWWEDKPANRLPEALWCSFVPRAAEPAGWTIDKLGRPVSPLDVVRRGGRALHGVGDGMSYTGADGALRIRTLDAALVAPGRPNLLDADPPVPDLAGGFHVLLQNNCWGTNFPMWSEGPARFRFTIEVG